MTSDSRPFSLLLELYGDAQMATILGQSAVVEAWLRVERELANAQAKCGVISPEAAADICQAAQLGNIDFAEVWEEARTVGYPILGVVRMIDRATTGAGTGRVHYGATTQDIMDSGLALNLRDAGHRLLDNLQVLGDVLAQGVEEHSMTIMAGRTHAQHAVPTTFGAKLAAILSELSRQRIRLLRAMDDAAAISLYGAAGTSAAYGPTGPEVREVMSAALGLRCETIPWHVARDSLHHFASVAASIAETCARFAIEVINLSRTEIAELSEARGWHRGASSTMPQKRNPVQSEAIVGMAASASALMSAMSRAMEAGHERAAGEWHIEWQTLPQICTLSSSAIVTATSILRGLEVNTNAMAENLTRDHGLIMSEAFMIALSESLGREKAHDLVYGAAQTVREFGGSLPDTLRNVMDADLAPIIANVTARSYLGETEAICAEALRVWEAGPRAMDVAS
jgi:3-carboxy-cis,cis-muconate cycloisomerase